METGAPRVFSEQFQGVLFPFWCRLLRGQRNKTEWLFAGILVVGIIGILTDVMIRGVNRLVFGWREADA